MRITRVVLLDEQKLQDGKSRIDIVPGRDPLTLRLEGELLYVGDASGKVRVLHMSRVKWLDAELEDVKKAAPR